MNLNDEFLREHGLTEAYELLHVYQLNFGLKSVRIEVLGDLRNPGIFWAALFFENADGAWIESSHRMQGETVEQAASAVLSHPQNQNYVKE